MTIIIKNALKASVGLLVASIFCSNGFASFLVSALKSNILKSASYRTELRHFSKIKICDILKKTNSDDPYYVFRPNALAKACKTFTQQYLIAAYAVKANPNRDVLKILLENGINSFDVASIAEAKAIRDFSNHANLYFMHPIKTRSAISQAYHEYGIRSFSLDSFAELQKIKEVLPRVTDIRPFVRLSVSNMHSEWKLANKFGIDSVNGIKLLKACSSSFDKIGLGFHVGSQCTNPESYRDAIRYAAKLVKENDIKIDMLDIGGGFPSVYTNMTQPPIQAYFDAIDDEYINSGLKCELLCEPGRAIVAESGAVIVKVLSRKGAYLYINDGKYGNLFEIGKELIPPVRAIRLDGNFSDVISDFSFYGPTCDSVDVLTGSFKLPQDMREGDYIEIANMGAYSTASCSNFNGFGKIPKGNLIITEEPPIVSAYD